MMVSRVEFEAIIMLMEMTTKRRMISSERARTRRRAKIMARERKINRAVNVRMKRAMTIIVVVRRYKQHSLMVYGEKRLGYRITVLLLH
jgi:hypothetical protein